MIPTQITFNLGWKIHTNFLWNNNNSNYNQNGNIGNLNNINFNIPQGNLVSNIGINLKGKR